MTTMSLAEAFVDSDREFWHGVLTGGGFTAIPRWTRDPVPGVAGYEAPVPGDLLPALRQRAAELGVPLSSMLLAAHAKVLAALCGESEVVTGYMAALRGVPLPCRLVTAPGSWRAVLRQAHRTEWELLAHQDFPVGDLAGELGLAGPAFETVFDALGGEGTLAPDTVLWVSIWPHRGRLALRLRYRTDVLDADAAARIAGYHLTALAQIAADPEAEHGRQTLLSPEELSFQLDGLAGPRRERPDRRMHELFEQRVRTHPDAIAATCGDRQWTYAELNAHANRLARALLARGLRREGVVAVVTERNLDWMAAVLAIFKAGGVYLPIEPHFPADRIARTLTRAGCELVLTEPGSTTTLGPALDGMPAVRTLFAEAAYQENHADDDLGIEVGPDQLAYIYFTSGSTGEPKGAMCEHAGMLNHLYAKIDDLEIGAGQVVAQTAPQCFDISMWQLVSALLAGGRTLLVEQEVILDVGRFLDTIIDGRVNVLQVVPSYLEVVLSYLDRHSRELPDLRYVSVTGEALKPELAQRWFAAKPGIRLVNAYGLTETSDDTNHEVMDKAPDDDRVPLGRPVGNVRVYVVDEDLRPVPLGAAGLIAFSGVCVGRGYINDPERTRQAYLADPHREGQRLYLGGDYGRWRPDGKLEFLGRRDSQVKISGFRIEIGEIENTLLRVPGVRDGAVVVAARPGQGQRLVAFYSSPGPIEAGVLRDRLGTSLPWYMVPSAFHWLESLPLTANHKTDKKTLTALATEPDAATGTDHDAPGTPTERRLAAAWAKVLGISRGRDQQARQLLRPGRLVAAGREAGDHSGPRGVSQGTDPSSGARRHGRAGRRQVRTAIRAAPAATGTARLRCRRPGVLPVRGRQRGELPVDGQRPAGQRAGRLRGRAARPRPGRRGRAVRLHGTGGGAGCRRDHRPRPEPGPALGPFLGYGVRAGHRGAAGRAGGRRGAGVPRSATARQGGRAARQRHRSGRTEQRRDRRGAERGQRLHRAR